MQIHVGAGVCEIESCGRDGGVGTAKNKTFFGHSFGWNHRERDVKNGKDFYPPQTLWRIEDVHQRDQQLSGHSQENKLTNRTYTSFTIPALLVTQKNNVSKREKAHKVISFSSLES